MTHLKFLLLILVALQTLLNGCATTKSDSIAFVETKTNSKSTLEKPYVLLVSIDGFRHDYTTKFQAPNLTRIKSTGVAATSLIPSFPSKTFPNHLSIVTGRYPENHGIVANYFYDFSRPHADQLYKLANRQAVNDSSWYNALPIWIQAENQGMLTGTYFWPAAEVAFDGVKSTYTLQYDEKVPNEDRINTVFEWFKLSQVQRPHLVSLYFSEVDTAGHTFGTESPELKAAVLNIDRSIGLIVDKIRESGLPINLVIVSDHGMHDLDENKIIYIDDLTDLSQVTVGDLGPQMLIYSPQTSEASQKTIGKSIVI